MKGINKVILIGNLGKDPEVQKLEGDITVAKFTLATTETYKDKQGNRVDQTEWHNIVAWRQLADFCGKYLHKGSSVYVEGKLKTSSWTDKENNKKYRTEIIADTISFLDKKPSDSGNDSNHTNTASSQEHQEQMADDLPF
jgi:single-strand DNA-binding protein